MTADDSTDRAELLKFLRERAFVFSDENHDLFDRSGRSIPWVYYHWGLSLIPRTSRLVARCMLRRLESFGSKQLVCFGTTGLPIVSACIALADDQYCALAVRSTRELHGTGRLIEGTANKEKSVVIVDDCLCSGASLKKAITILESEGYSVEGCLAV